MDAEEGEPAQAADTSDAVLDPWCTVLLNGGHQVLFGYAVTHPVTGGLAWLRSSPVTGVDEVRRQARTESGRQYSLGRRIRAAELPGLGLEPWLAYDLLVAPHAVDTGMVPPISADSEREERWITACKIARHLRITPPSLAPAEVEPFLARHLGPYTRARRQADRPG